MASCRCATVLPPLIAAISASSGNCPRVRAHAVTALIAVIASGDFACPTEAVTPNLEPMLRALAELMTIPMAAARIQVRSHLRFRVIVSVAVSQPCMPCPVLSLCCFTMITVSNPRVPLIFCVCMLVFVCMRMFEYRYRHVCMVLLCVLTDALRGQHCGCLCG